jgi:hypothetical protein
MLTSITQQLVVVRGVAAARVAGMCASELHLLANEMRLPNNYRCASNKSHSCDSSIIRAVQDCVENTTDHTLRQTEQMKARPQK